MLKKNNKTVIFGLLISLLTFSQTKCSFLKAVKAVTIFVPTYIASTYAILRIDKKIKNSHFFTKKKYNSIKKLSNPSEKNIKQKSHQTTIKANNIIKVLHDLFNLSKKNTKQKNYTIINKTKNGQNTIQVNGMSTETNPNTGQKTVKIKKIFIN